MLITIIIIIIITTTFVDKYRGENERERERDVPRLFLSRSSFSLTLPWRSSVKAFSRRDAKLPFCAGRRIGRPFFTRPYTKHQRAFFFSTNLFTGVKACVAFHRIRETFSSSNNIKARAASAAMEKGRRGSGQRRRRWRRRRRSR